jgi:heme-degrading monooxygenase HmoA
VIELPALPWTARQPIDPGRSYLVMASRLPLRAHRSIPGFLRDAMEIRGQLARADGLVGYGLQAELGRKVFWTFSAWADQASLDAFARSDPHRRITRRLAPFMGETRFETLTVAGERLPLGWPEIQQQILGGSPRR